MITLDFIKSETKELFIADTNYKLFSENHELQDILRNNFKWNKEAKKWVTDNAVNLLRAYYALVRKKMQVDLTSELSQNINRFRNLYALSRATTPSHPGLFENMPKIAREYQLAAVEYLLRTKRCIFADDMGLGKTCSTILTLSYLFKKDPTHVALIVTPAHMKFVWIDELEKFALSEVKVQVYHGKEVKIVELEPPSDRKVVSSKMLVLLINYEIFGKYLADIASFSPTICVFDEAHYLKTYTTKRARTALSLITNVNPPYVFLLTGTPVTRDNRDMFSLLKILNHPLSQDRYHFMKTYADMQETQIAGRKVQTFGFSNQEELNMILRSTCFIRRTKEQVLHELPSKTRQLIILDSDDVEKLLKQEQDILEGLVANPSDLDAVLSALKNPINSVTIKNLSKVRQELCLKKIPVVVNFVDEILKYQQKVVIFAWHQTVIKALREALVEVYGTEEVVTITGLDTTTLQKQMIINQFQNAPNPRILLASIAAVATGVTLTAASTAIFVEVDWIPSNVMQAEDRIYRIGQKNPVNVYYIAFEKSIESRVIKKMLKRKEKIDKVMK